MKLVLKYLKKYTKESILAPLFKLLEACFDLLVPIIVKQIIDVGIKNNDNSYIIKNFVILLILGAVGLGFAVSAQYFAAKAAIGAATAMRHSLFSHLQGFSYTETDTLGTSSMITRITTDINQLQNGINMVLRLFLRSPIIIFGAAIMAFSIKPEVAIVFVGIIPMLAVVVFGIILAGIPLYRKVQGKLDKVTLSTRENLNGTRVIRAFNKEKSEIEDFDAVNREHTSVQNFTGKISGLMNPLTYVIVNIGIILIIKLSAPIINEGNMLTGELVAMYNYMTQILVELVKLANTIFLVTKALACSKRIQSAFDIPAEPVTDKKNNIDYVSADKSVPAVQFENVSLTYRGGGAPSLSGIDFSAMQGMTIGIIGGTGSGKSSLVNMIPGFYPASEGKVSFFGKDVKEYDSETLRSSVGIVPQKAVLFAGTVRSNLLWGKADATEDEMWEALELAQAKEFIQDKEGQLDAPVAQNGRNFSGGQRQRLTIARAIVGKPPVLILDDSASALDFATESRLRQAIAGLEYNPTVFIISQRTSSISHADMIIVLDDGAMVGIGKHEELLKCCDVYREIYDSQYKAASESKEAK